ncbi:lactose/cellobiose PTS transporter subunit IIB [Streptococcus sp. zg-JUN1979]|uniref:lactose/cellobiose PTS transporter subunit IIB n=1 Tax=Streptococcus sp. zg-JUN1979 TaxID=3391450 RepID=UPI0039A6D22C
MLAEEKSAKKELCPSEQPVKATSDYQPKETSPSSEASLTNALENPINVLVLCAGGGTSGLLANALTKAAKEYQLEITATATGYGAHRDILKEYDLVILAPQVASNYADIKQETDGLGIKLAKTQGAQYIRLTRDGKAALDFVRQML